MIPLAMTLSAWGFLWFSVSLVIGAIWCSVCLIAEKVNKRNDRRRRARRGGDVDMVVLCRPRDRRLP